MPSPHRLYFFLESPHTTDSRSSSFVPCFAWLQGENNQVGGISALIVHFNLKTVKALLYLVKNCVNSEKKKKGVRSVPTRISSGTVVYRLCPPLYAEQQTLLLSAQRSSIAFSPFNAPGSNLSPRTGFFWQIFLLEQRLGHLYFSFPFFITLVLWPLSPPSSQCLFFSNGALHGKLWRDKQNRLVEKYHFIGTSTPRWIPMVTRQP